YEGFDVGDVLPNAQALPEQGAGYVEIGIASLGGQATANSGLVGTIRFSTTAAFTSTAIRLVRAELGRGGRFETIMPNIGIALQGASTPANFSLSLDVDGSAGDQAVTSANVSADEIVAIQIFGTDIQNANGLSVRFEYDASQVVYEGFDVGDVLPNAQALPSQSTNPTYVEIGIVSLGGQATANNGLIGTVRLRTTAAFSGTEIRLVRAELGRGGQIESVTIDVRVALELQALTPDFNGDGVVNFADFLAFVGQFGTRQGDGRYEAKYDLDSDGTIGFGDFLIFSSSFDKGGSPPGGGSGGGSGGSTTDVAIPDANLRAVIANKLGKASGAPISRAEMATLTVLEAPNSNISDLTGLEYATNLTRLDLGAERVYRREVSSIQVGFVKRRPNLANSNEISNLSPLSGMTRLEYLDLGRNLISDVSVLSGMVSLTYLDLYDNYISDVSALSRLTNLTSLDLYNNLISNVSALASMTGLESLFLEQNSISDVSALASLTSLETLNLENNVISDVSALSGLTSLADLDIGENTISDISALANLSNLKWLDLENNVILDVSALASLTRLETLFLEGNVISDLSPLSNLANLTDLDFSGNVISDVSALANLTSLIRLWFHANTISDLSPLGNLTNLERIGFNNNTISDLTPLSNLINLTHLQIWGNNISNVSPLGGLTNLVSLYLHGNPVSDVSPLSGLTNLRFIGLNGAAITDVSALVSALSNLTNLTSIFLGNNAISDISALSRMTRLKWLYLHENAISDIPALANLTNREKLLLFSNSISDLSPLVANTGLGEEDQVDVRNNPLSATSINTHIPALQGRGVNVSFGALKPGIEETEPRMLHPENEDIVNGGRP
ncbi:MAG: leucine-rich repeat domain-containing protein, partial [Candidatus Poribacteria bacterium]|nr:leucine-rich repeat domain-containing protein [Candidatus Poribacteria bacterium]